MTAAATQAQSPLSYLQAVYPAAGESLTKLSHHDINETFELLQYLYACDVEGLSPHFDRSAHCRKLPYIPAGAYYSASGKATTSISVFSGGHFFRYPEPIQVILRKELHDWDSTWFHSSYGGRAGPTPAWTSPLALVRYPLYPLGFVKVTTDGHASVRTGRVAGAERPSLLPLRSYDLSENSRVHVRLASHPAVAGLSTLADGDLIEVEQWGGWLSHEQCPPICGLWGNLWRGTGVAMRVSTPFVSLNKGTAIIEMLLALGERGATDGLDAIVSDMGLGVMVGRLRRAHPAASRAHCVAAAVLTRDPCPATQQRHRFDATVSKWLAYARGASPRALVDTFLALGAKGGGVGSGFRRAAAAAAKASAVGQSAATDERTRGDGWPLGTLNDAERFGLFWLWGACGIGPLGWDRLLQALACMLGHQTVVLSASSNDNGLLHQEFADFELPPSLAWRKHSHAAAAGARAAAAGSPAIANEPRFCLEPFRWVARDRRPGAQQRRRAQLWNYWDVSRKFRMPVALPTDRLPIVRAKDAWAPGGSERCDLRFGAVAEQVEGNADVCSYSFPAGLATEASAAKACWAWCNHSLSASHAFASLLHFRKSLR